MARTAHGHARNHDEAGFTLVEVIIVLIVAMLLMDIAAAGFAGARQATAVESAEYSFRALQARARAHAIERGDGTRLELDPFSERALLIVGTDTLETLDFHDAYGVDVTSTVGGSPAALVQCMTSRGLADGPCTSFGTPAEIAFIQGDRSRSIRLLPLGQVLD